MTTNTTKPYDGEGRSEPRARQTTLPGVMYIANVPPDICVTRAGTTNGAKTPAKIEFRLGGTAGNGAAVAVANGIACGVAGVQAAGILADWSRQLASACGLVPFVTDRQVRDPAVTVATENGKPGTYDLFVQRMGCLAVHEVTPAARAAIIAAKAVVVGPMPISDPAFDLLRFAARLSQFAVLIPHPTLTRRTHSFAEVGRQFDYVQLNLAEAQLLDPAIRDLPRLACRVRFLLGERVEFAITNGGQRGLLWADGHWLEIVPPPIDVVSDIGAGDAFASAYVIARRLFHVGVRKALDYAISVASAAVSGTAVPALV